MADKFEGLGIFIDTYKNNRPGTIFPYVSAMLGDGQTAYDKDNDGKSTEIAGCSVCEIERFRLTFCQIADTRRSEAFAIRTSLQNSG